MSEGKPQRGVRDAARPCTRPLTSSSQGGKASLEKGGCPQRKEYQGSHKNKSLTGLSKPVRERENNLPEKRGERKKVSGGLALGKKEGRQI